MALSLKKSHKELSARSFLDKIVPGTSSLMCDRHQCYLIIIKAQDILLLLLPMEKLHLAYLMLLIFIYRQI